VRAAAATIRRVDGIVFSSRLSNAATLILRAVERPC